MRRLDLEGFLMIVKLRWFFFRRSCWRETYNRREVGVSALKNRVELRESFQTRKTRLRPGCAERKWILQNPLLGPHCSGQLAFGKDSDTFASLGAVNVAACWRWRLKWKWNGEMTVQDKSSIWLHQRWDQVCVPGEGAVGSCGCWLACSWDVARCAGLRWVKPRTLRPILGQNCFKDRLFTDGFTLKSRLHFVFTPAPWSEWD